MRLTLFIIFLALALDIQGKELSIALVTDSSSHFTERARHQVIQEIEDLLQGEHVLSFSEVNEFQGRGNIKSVEDRINNALKDPQYDYVVGLGFIASYVLTHKSDFLKPSFAPFILNHKLQNAPFQEGSSGEKNLNYTEVCSTLNDELNLFRELTPFRQLTILISPHLKKTMPNLRVAADRWAFDNGISVSFLELGQQIPQKSDAIFLTPLPEMEKSKKIALLQSINRKKIPTFSWIGQRDVELGALACSSNDVNLSRVSRRLALNIQRTLHGEMPQSLPVALNAHSGLTINMKTASKIDVFPPWELLLESKQIHQDQVDQGSYLSFLNAINEGLCANRSLAVQRYQVASGQERVAQARSPLNPQIHVNSLARLIDQDRARLGIGAEPQAAASGIVTGSQVLYSSELNGKLRAERFAQNARCWLYQSSALDTAFQTARAYLNVLRAKTLENIQRNNLRLTRNNLQISKHREESGVASASEVYRWESSLANDQTRVINAKFAKRSSLTVLNRLLSRPQDTQSHLENVLLTSPYWLQSGPWLAKHIKDDQDLELYIEHTTYEGHKLSPEISELNQKICSQKEILGISDRAFWSPTLALKGEIDHRYAVGGARGRTGITSVDRTDWHTALDLSFPLYQGGKKCADFRQAKLDLYALCTQKEALAEEIEEKIRVSIYDAITSFAAIDLSKVSSASAHKNLNLISDAYAKGTRPIIDLLDAQHQALVADLITANAIYDFLIDLLRVQRAVGRFDFFMTEKEKEKWKMEFDQFLEQRK